MATKSTGLSIGSTWSKKTRSALAPSISAASSGSCGMVCRPASKIKNIRGVHSQTSSRTMPRKAVDAVHTQHSKDRVGDADVGGVDQSPHHPDHNGSNRHRQDDSDPPEAHADKLAIHQQREPQPEQSLDD